METGKGRIPVPSLPGFLRLRRERVTLVYEGGTRNVKKKQWVLETTVPVSEGWRLFACGARRRTEYGLNLCSESREGSVVRIGKLKTAARGFRR